MHPAVHFNKRVAQASQDTYSTHAQTSQNASNTLQQTASRKLQPATVIGKNSEGWGHHHCRTPLRQGVC